MMAITNILFSRTDLFKMIIPLPVMSGFKLYLLCVFFRSLDHELSDLQIAGGSEHTVHHTLWIYGHSQDQCDTFYNNINEQYLSIFLCFF